MEVSCLGIIDRRRMKKHGIAMLPSRVRSMNHSNQRDLMLSLNCVIRRR